jgi:2-polyprenyl-3-methyl-5-hydroxy-6-metoxy-1,4-benzoquinol methylase
MYDDKFYDSMATAYLEKTAWTKLRLAQVKRMVDPQPGDKIIDLGCGMGAVAHFCSTFGAQVVGVDLSPVAIQVAKRLFEDAHIAFYERDVCDLHGIDDESFGKAVSADLVEHITQPSFEDMVRETFRVLRPGGTFSIYTPNPTHVIERMKACNCVLKQNPTHIDLKSKDRIVVTLEATGFKAKQAYFVPSFIPVFNLIERAMMPLPAVGALFRYRICVSAVKPAGGKER